MRLSINRQWCNADGTINARYQVEVQDLNWVKELHDRHPKGNKSSLPAFVAKSADNYLVIVEDRGIGFIPVNWTQLDGRLNQSPLPAIVDLTLIDEDDEYSYQVTVHMLNV